MNHHCSADSSTAVRAESTMSSPSAVPVISTRKLTQYFQRFSSARILVIGDLILDHFVWGRVHRISPEAPVPVVHVDSESFRMGGAANVYHNILTLGGQAELCGVVGADPAGKQFMTDIRRYSRHSPGIFIDPGRPTITKTRVIAHNQQIVRFDVEQCHPIAVPLSQKLIRYVASRLHEISCLVISDYAKGLMTGELMKTIQQLANRHGVPVVVDPKVEHMGYYEGVTIITPNYLEAKQAAGFHPRQDVPIEQIGIALQKQLQCRAVVITRGEEGMSIFEESGQSWTIPAVARQVYDVTGAGDTVVSTLALALSAKAPLPDAAVLANQAAGIVVGMVGTATVTQAQLQEVFLHERP